MRRLATVIALLALAGCGGGDGSDGGTLTGTAQDDQLAGTEGADKLEGGAGEDAIEGKGGADEIDGGADPDFLYGGDGDDRFLESEDDAVDVHDCGPGKDLVAEPDTRDELLPNCETAGWTAKPPSEEPYENEIAANAKVGPKSLEFRAACPTGCAGDIELRTPRDRRLLGQASFRLPAGEPPSPIEAPLNREGRELAARGGYVRVVLRSGKINSGFTTFIRR